MSYKLVKFKANPVNAIRVISRMDRPRGTDRRTDRRTEGKPISHRTLFGGIISGKSSYIISYKSEKYEANPSNGIGVIAICVIFRNFPHARTEGNPISPLYHLSLNKMICGLYSKQCSKENNIIFSPLYCAGRKCKMAYPVVPSELPGGD